MVNHNPKGGCCVGRKKDTPCATKSKPKKAVKKRVPKKPKYVAGYAPSYALKGYAKGNRFQSEAEALAVAKSNRDRVSAIVKRTVRGKTVYETRGANYVRPSPSGEFTMILPKVQRGRY